MAEVLVIAVFATKSPKRCFSNFLKEANYCNYRHFYERYAAGMS
jgi:hypothetical protein